MNKKRIVLASTLAILIAPTILGGLQNPTITQAAETNLEGTVRRGGSILYNGNGEMIANAFLPNYTTWKLGKSFTKDGTTFYQVATNQYVESNSVSITGAANKVLNPTTNETGLETVNPVATIKNGGGTVYDANGNASARVLPNGSAWKVANAITLNGEQYLQVGGNEYIKSSGSTIYDNQVAPSTNQNTTKKTGLLVSTAKVVNAAGRDTGITLPSGSSWQLGNSVQIGASYYYQVATNEYILVSAVHVQGTNAVDKPVNPGTIGTANPVNTTINLTNASKILDDNGNDTGKILPANSSWHADQTKTMHNYLYYRVAPNQWVTNGGFYGSEQIFANGPVAVTLTKNVQLYDTSSNSMTRFLPKGTAWRAIKSVQNNKGQFFIQVSSNEWIPLAQGIFVDYSDGNTLYNGFAYSSTYEPGFATNILK